MKDNWKKLPAVDVPDLCSIYKINKNIKSCVYFVSSNSKGLLYIGLASGTLRNRFLRYISSLEMAHKCVPLIMFYKDCSINYLVVDEIFLNEIEKGLIHYYSPYFNCQHVDPDKSSDQDFSDYEAFRKILCDYDCVHIDEANDFITGKFKYSPEYLDIKKARRRALINSFSSVLESDLLDAHVQVYSSRK